MKTDHLKEILHQAHQSVHTRLAKAILLAESAHEGQKDKAGEDYIFHPLRVMDSMQTEEEKIVAVLHDVIEDTSVDANRIEAIFGVEIRQGVEAVSRRQGEVYMDFIRRSKLHPIGRLVKIADIKDNMLPERVACLPAKEQGIVNRYKRALSVLEN